MSRRRWLLATTLAVLGCGFPQSAGDTVRVTIPRGATLAAVAESLHAAAVIRSQSLFRFYARLGGRARTVQAGTYELPRGARQRRLLELLQTGRPAAKRLVLPEGLMLTEIADQVERQLGIPRDSVLAAARDSALRARFDVPAASLEGYLYPSTYLVRADARARDVVRQMAEEFAARWRPAWDARRDSLGLTRHELVTLASIIEGEVRVARDRRFVSSVYHNRLRRGMRLQADPTVIYALGRRRRLFEKDYQTRSPYNTYLINGLPPGPIGSPSAASIDAALSPARTDFLYFVARPDGQHVFSRTLQEHLETIRDVRRLERELGVR